MAYESIVNFMVAQAAENVNERKRNETPEGIAVAVGSLVIMALLSIFFGSYRSVSFHKDQKRETITAKDAAMFPIMASFALFGLYIMLKRFSKKYIDFFCLGVLGLMYVLRAIVSKLVPGAVPNYRLLFRQDIINYKYSHNIVAFICYVGVEAWYLTEKHWVANNLLALEFAVNEVTLLHLNNFVTGCILLCGLFIYDIFWVFGTDVMETVAISFEVPNKLMFPQDLLTHGLFANNFAMLGLGDVVFPGIFIALLLRFDHSLKRQSKLYFHATLIAYFLGLMAAIFVMHMFKHAQPALLYLVPACLGTPLAVAWIKGDLTALFKYEDNGDGTKEKKKDAKQVKATESKKVK